MYNNVRNSVFSRRNIATLYLLAMCVQLVFLEGSGVSPVKVTLMAIAPILLLWKADYFSRAVIWGSVYVVAVLFFAMLHFQMRFSTIGFLGMCIITFMLYYNLLYKNAFSLTYFISLIRFIIIAYGTVLILQQLCILVGLYNFPILNLVGQVYLDVTKVPSLSLEPSHSARIMGAAYYSYLYSNSLQSCRNLTLKDIFSKEHRKVTILFLWGMLTMGSGTAMVFLSIIGLYFVKGRSAILSVPILLLFAFFLGSVGDENVMRVQKMTEAVITGDVENIIKADHSGASRITPIVNTINNIDVTSESFWIGNGTIMENTDVDSYDADMRTKQISTIEQYGYIAWVISLLFVYQCIIRKFWSVETAIFILAMGFNVGNIYYVWGIFMMFAALKYFSVLSKHYTDYNQKGLD